MERSVQTPTLDIGYVESGDPSGVPIILLHGFPDDVHAYDDVAPLLAAAGHRVLVPYLRGYGSTRFRDADTPRLAEQAAIGQDVVDFADALDLQRFVVCGYDWGGRAACIAAVLQPERVRAVVSIGRYPIQDVFSPPHPSAPHVEAAYWYQWYFNTERGRIGLTQNRHDLCKLLWQQWSPTWSFSDATYEQTAGSFDNPDFVDCVIHSYRHRNLGAEGDPQFEAVERHLATQPPITAPTIVLYGGADGLSRPSTDDTNDRALFPRLVARRIVEGAGHFMPRENPQAVASAILEVLAAS